MWKLLTLFALAFYGQLMAQENFNGMMSTYGDTAFDGYNGIMEVLYIDKDTADKALIGIMTTYEPQPPGLEGKENGLMDTYHVEMATEKPIRLLPFKNDLLPAISMSFYFEINSFSLSSASRDTLEKLLPILKSDGITKIHLWGYTDQSGPVTFNQRLSLMRAEALKNWLVANGVKASMVETKGLGPQPGNGQPAETFRRVDLKVELK